MPTALIVADSFVHASLPSAELCMRTCCKHEAQKEKGEQNQKWPKTGVIGNITRDPLCYRAHIVAAN